MLLLLFFINTATSQGGFSGKLTLRISCSKIIGSIMREKGSWAEQGKENHKTITVKALAHPLGSSQARMALQNHPVLRKGSYLL